MCVSLQARVGPFVVAPEEADMQVGRQNWCAVVLCRDSDLIAYGHMLIFIIDSYGGGALAYDRHVNHCYSGNC